MRRILGTVLLLGTLNAQESFITPEEYAAQLYHNPRGIGCHLCHGERAEGKKIAVYMHKKERKVFAGPSLHGIEYRAFAKALNSRVGGMPRYFLTDAEIRALYFYIEQQGVKDGNK